MWETQKMEVQGKQREREETPALERALPDPPTPNSPRQPQPTSPRGVAELLKVLGVLAVAVRAVLAHGPRVRTLCGRRGTVSPALCCSLGCTALHPCARLAICDRRLRLCLRLGLRGDGRVIARKGRHVGGRLGRLCAGSCDSKEAVVRKEALGEWDGEVLAAGAPWVLADGMHREAQRWLHDEQAQDEVARGRAQARPQARLQRGWRRLDALQQRALLALPVQ